MCPVIQPLESTLHLLLLLVGLFNLVGDPCQELLKIGQEVRLISPELGPKTAHLAWTGGWEEEKTQRVRLVELHHSCQVWIMVCKAHNRLNTHIKVCSNYTHSSNTLLAPRLSSSIEKCLSSSSSTPDSLASHWL